MRLSCPHAVVILDVTHSLLVVVNLRHSRGWGYQDILKTIEVCNKRFCLHLFYLLEHPYIKIQQLQLLWVEQVSLLYEIRHKTSSFYSKQSKNFTRITKFLERSVGSYRGCLWIFTSYEKLQISVKKNIFLIFALNIECGYTF